MSSREPAVHGEHAASNQTLANAIASAIRKARLSGFEIEITVQNGEATLEGIVSCAEQRAVAEEAATSVVGIIRIVNLLTIEGQTRKPFRRGVFRTW